MYGADELPTVPFVVEQQQVITLVAGKNCEFKGDYNNSLVIGAKTFFT